LQSGDRRHEGDRLQPIYRSDAKNPSRLMDQMQSAVEHTNFFENRRAALWERRSASLSS